MQTSSVKHSENIYRQKPQLFEKNYKANTENSPTEKSSKKSSTSEESLDCENYVQNRLGSIIEQTKLQNKEFEQHYEKPENPINVFDNKNINSSLNKNRTHSEGLCNNNDGELQKIANSSNDIKIEYLRSLGSRDSFNFITKSNSTNNCKDNEQISFEKNTETSKSYSIEEKNLKDINVFFYIRKRPILPQEATNQFYKDCIEISNPYIKLLKEKHSNIKAKKIIESTSFFCDNAYDETYSTQDIYKFNLKPFFENIRPNDRKQ